MTNFWIRFFFHFWSKNFWLEIFEVEIFTIFSRDFDKNRAFLFYFQLFRKNIFKFLEFI